MFVDPTCGGDDDDDEDEVEEEEGGGRRRKEEEDGDDVRKLCTMQIYAAAYCAHVQLLGLLLLAFLSRDCRVGVSILAPHASLAFVM